MELWCAELPYNAVYAGVAIGWNYITRKKPHTFWIVWNMYTSRCKNMSLSDKMPDPVAQDWLIIPLHG